MSDFADVQVERRTSMRQALLALEEDLGSLIDDFDEFFPAEDTSPRQLMSEAESCVRQAAELLKATA